MIQRFTFGCPLPTESVVLPVEPAAAVPYLTAEPDGSWSFSLAEDAVVYGLGFFMAMVIFSGVRSRVEDAEPPKSFEGLPITLVSASIVSLSFFGFSGVLDRLFGG